MIEFLLYTTMIAVVCIGAYLKKSLTISGSVAAFGVGSCISLGFGWRGLILLGVFFVTSSQWSKYKKTKKVKLEEILEKGAQRDWLQVFANGAIASLCALLYWYTEGGAWQVAFIVSLAAANADTWASEIGVLSKRKPRYILSLKRVEKGTSGAVSSLGSLAAFGGSLLIVMLSLLLISIPSAEIVFWMIICGLLGCFIDTLLGATVQVKFQCEQCGIMTEKTIHCQNRTKVVKGVRFINNDAVNFLSIFFASAVSVMIFYLV